MEGLTEGRIVHYVMPDGQEHRPAIVVKVWRKEDGTPPDNGISNLQVFTDGTNDYQHNKGHDGFEYMSKDEIKTGIVWKTSVEFSAEPKPHTWHWIEKA
jgi:hypothetical protein